MVELRTTLKEDFLAALPFCLEHRKQNNHLNKTLDQMIDDFRAWQVLSTGTIDLIYNYYRYYFYFKDNITRFTDKNVSPVLLEDLWGLAFASILTRTKTPIPIIGSVCVDISGQKFKKHTKAVTNAFVNYVSRGKEELLKELQEFPLKLLSPELQSRWAQDEALAKWPGSIIGQSPKGIHAVDRLSKYKLYSREDFFNQDQLCVLNPGSWQLTKWVENTFPKSHLEEYSVLDTCAAPGGKCIALATKPSHAKFYATDSSPRRIKRLNANIERMGFTDKIITAQKKWGDKQSSLPSEWPQSFDFVLVDLPCSGSGTILTQSDVMIKNIGHSVDELAPIQSAIIDEVLSKYANSNIFISTCSVDPKEIANINSALKRTEPDFRSHYSDEAFTEGLVGWKVSN